MVSGSRACLTSILSDHPHRPSLHFGGARDAGATVTAADPLPETLIVRLDASHDYQPRRQVLANRAMVGQRWPVERTCLGPTQYGKLR
jgi:hypothetical protein